MGAAQGACKAGRPLAAEARALGWTNKLFSKSKGAALKAAPVRLRRREQRLSRCAALLVQAVPIRGRSGLISSDRDVAVLKIPLDIGSPPFDC